MANRRCSARKRRRDDRSETKSIGELALQLKHLALAMASIKTEISALQPYLRKSGVANRREAKAYPGGSYSVLYRNQAVRALAERLSAGPLTIGEIHLAIVGAFGGALAPSKSAIGRFVRRARTGHVSRLPETPLRATKPARRSGYPTKSRKIP